MMLCLDVGNTLVFGGVFQNDELVLTFRHPTRPHCTSDELGIFLRTVLKENSIHPASISSVSICTVVPSLSHSLRNCCLKYFDTEPFFLRFGVKTGLKIRYRNPMELGADRISNAVAGANRYPDQNLIIADLGTATTLCAVSKEREYLGGSILAGIKISAEALESRTSQLPSVAIVQPKSALGKSTGECIQSGLYYGTLGMLRELISRMKKEAFADEEVFVLGTSGLSSLFEDAGVFNAVEPDLVLHGLKDALLINRAMLEVTPTQ